VPNDLRALDIKEVRANNGNLIALNTKSNDGTNETVLILEYLPSLKTQAAVEAA